MNRLGLYLCSYSAKCYQKHRTVLNSTDKEKLPISIQLFSLILCMILLKIAVTPNKKIYDKVGDTFNIVRISRKSGLYLMQPKISIFTDFFLHIDSSLFLYCSVSILLLLILCCHLPFIILLQAVFSAFI